MICPHCGSVKEDPALGVPESAKDHVPTALSGYGVDVQIGGEIVRFFGPCGNLRARVFRGTITRQVFNALKSIESPAMKAYFIGDIVVRMPRVFEKLDNQGPNRRFIAFYGAGSGNLVLEMIGGATISRELEYAIRGAFPSKNSSPEEEGEGDGRNGTEVEPAECIGEEEHSDASGGPGVEEQGDDPEHGEPAERAEDGEVVVWDLSEANSEAALATENQMVAEALSKVVDDRGPSVDPDPSPVKALSESIKPFVTIRKGGVKAPPPKRKYYTRPRGL